MAAWRFRERGAAGADGACDILVAVHRRTRPARSLVAGAAPTTRLRGSGAIASPERAAGWSASRPVRRWAAGRQPVDGRCSDQISPLLLLGLNAALFLRWPPSLASGAVCSIRWAGCSNNGRRLAAAGPEAGCAYANFAGPRGLLDPAACASRAAALPRAATALHLHRGGQTLSASTPGPRLSAQKVSYRRK